MGSVDQIDVDRFPTQGPWLGRRVWVCFHYRPERKLPGEVVRDDAEEPGVGIIRLDDGRHVLMTECQWRPQ